MQWSRDDFRDRLGERAVIGMVHLRALPGAPGATPIDRTIDRALRDLESLEQGGVSAIMVENFGDRPFFATNVPPETIAAMTRVVTEMRSATSLPIGVNILRNDAHAALAVAVATGAAFLRVNILVGAMVTDQGIIEGAAASLLRKRAELGSSVAIFADHLVKHAVPLGSPDPLQLAKDLRLRGLADALVVTGTETGAAADPERIRQLRESIDAPLLVGSGISETNAHRYSEADGVIVGTSVKKDGDVNAAVDAARVLAVVSAFRR
jgi:uncharacterized protein